MNSTRVYYETATGRIIGHDMNSSVASMIEGHDHLEIGNAPAPHYKRHVVDIETLTIRQLTPKEQLDLQRPTELEIRSARYHELKETDWRETRQDWAAYRQTLRDITKAGETGAMIAAWPLRPDGSDAISGLRFRQG